jgi:hypothetical protein
MEKHRQKTLANIRASAFLRGSTSGGDPAEAIAKADKLLMTANAESRVQRAAVTSRRLSASSKINTRMSATAAAAAEKEKQQPKAEAVPAAAVPVAALPQQQQPRAASPSMQELVRARLRLQATVDSAIARVHRPADAAAAAPSRYVDPFFVDTALADGRHVAVDKASHGWAEKSRVAELNSAMQANNMMPTAASSDIMAIQQRASRAEQVLLAREKEIAAIKAKMLNDQQQKEKADARSGIARRSRGSSAALERRASSSRFGVMSRTKKAAMSPEEAALATTPVAAQRLAMQLSELLNDPLSPLSPMPFY